MDRLTKPGGSYCDDCVAFSKPDEFCEEYAACMDEIAMYDRLSAYEDTGLEPEEITEYLNATDEYVEASEEGRLIVLPCKVGDVCKHEVGEKYINPIGEVCVHCEIYGEQRNISLGECLGNCEAEAALGGDRDA